MVQNRRDFLKGSARVGLTPAKLGLTGVGDVGEQQKV